MKTKSAAVDPLAVAIAQLPETFGLRAFPARLFRVNRAASYIDSQAVPQIVLDVEAAAGWEQFARNTVETVLIHLVPSTLVKQQQESAMKTKSATAATKSVNAASVKESAMKTTKKSAAAVVARPSAAERSSATTAKKRAAEAAATTKVLDNGKVRDVVIATKTVETPRGPVAITTSRNGGTVRVKLAPAAAEQAAGKANGNGKAATVALAPKAAPVAAQAAAPVDRNEGRRAKLGKPACEKCGRHNTNGQNCQSPAACKRRADALKLADPAFTKKAPKAAAVKSTLPALDKLLAPAFGGKSKSSRKAAK
jgi:hypothetical protein